MSEELATGWERDTPDTDSIVLSGIRAMARGMSHPARVMGGRYEEWDDFVVADAGLPTFFANVAVPQRPLSDAAWHEAARRLCEWFDGAFAITSAFPTPDLTADGLTLAGHPPFMCRPPGGDRPSDPEGLRIEEVTDAGGLADFERTLVDGFPIEEMSGKAPGSYLDGRCLGGDNRYWVGYVGDDAVAVAGGHTGSVNDVEWVATLPAHRGRGYGEAVTWRATLADPGRPATLIASDLGRPVYERMGYLPLVRFTFWFRPGGGS
jgi:GNAT superfamily N-acetyltransferase